VNANTISKTLGTDHTRSTRSAGMIRGAGRRTPGFVARTRRGVVGGPEVVVECYGPNNGTTEHTAKLNAYRTTLESAGYVVRDLNDYFTGRVDAIVVVGTVAS
jgi:hypothetical protein